MRKTDSASTATMNAIPKKSLGLSGGHGHFMLTAYHDVAPLKSGRDIARHAQEPAKPHAAAADRLAGQRVIRKPRQESRDRNRAFQPRQRHPGALMRAGAEGEMPVRRTADIKTFGIGEMRRVAVGGADAQRHR